jgi:hypothetical protein
MECSCKSNYNIQEIFKTLVILSKIIPNNEPVPEPHGGSTSVLKRRSSAYVSATSKGNLNWIIPSLVSKSVYHTEILEFTPIFWCITPKWGVIHQRIGVNTIYFYPHYI